MRTRSPVPRLPNSRRDVLVSSPQPRVIPQREYLVRDQRTQSTLSSKPGPKYTQIRLQIPMNQNMAPHDTDKSYQQEQEKHRILRDYSHRDINNHEFQIELLRNENQQQQQQIQDLITELEKWQVRYQDLEKEGNMSASSYDELKVFKRVYQCAQQDVQDLQYENEHYKRIVNHQQEEISQLKSQQEQQHQKVVQLQTEIDKQGLIKQVELKKMSDQLQETSTHLEMQIKVREDIMADRNVEISNLKRQLLVQEGNLKEKYQQVEQKERLEQKYENLKDEKRTMAIEIAQLAQEVKCTKEQLTIKDEQSKKMMQQNAQQTLMTKELERHIEELQQDIEQLQDENSTLNERCHDYEEQINSQRFELECSKNDLLHQEELNQQLSEQLRLVSDQKQVVTCQLDETVDTLGIVNDQLHQTQCQLKQSETRVEELLDKVRSQNDNYNFLRSQLDQATSQLKSSNESCESYKEKHSIFMAQISQLEQEISARQAELGSLSDQYASLEGQYQTSQRQVQNLTASKNQLQSDLKVTGAQLDSLKIQLEQCKADRHSVQTQLKEQESLVGQLQTQKRDLVISAEMAKSDLAEMQNQYMQLETESNDRQLFHRNELDSWKEKFVNLNREFHKTQENLMMMTAEFDAVKQRKQGYLVKSDENNRKSFREPRAPLQEHN